jgi:lysophospholipase L1-like esterase
VQEGNKTNDSPTVVPPAGGGSGADASDGDARTSSSSSSGAVKDAAKPDAPAVDAGAQPTYRLEGRWDQTDPKRPLAAYAGTLVSARFRGPAVAVELEETARLGVDWLEVRIDGNTLGPVATVAGLAEYTLASDLPDEEHELTILKRTEASVGALRFVSIKAPGGQVLAPSAAPVRKIEFVGDSNTVGYGNEGASATCVFTPATENHAKSFAALTAREVTAEWSAIAYSSRGIIRNYDGSTTGVMPELYERTDPVPPGSAWSTDNFHPDVVVIALGQNDFTVGRVVPIEAELSAAMQTFLGRLRKSHPQALLVMMVSPTVHDDFPQGQSARTRLRGAFRKAKTALNTAGDMRVEVFEPAEATAAEQTGCDYHLSVAAHARISGELTPYLRAQLGW